MVKKPELKYYLQVGAKYRNNKIAKAENFSILSFFGMLSVGANKKLVRNLKWYFKIIPKSWIDSLLTAYLFELAKETRELIDHDSFGRKKRRR